MFDVLIGGDRMIVSTPAEMAESVRLNEVWLRAQRFPTTHLKPSSIKAISWGGSRRRSSPAA